jgi:hypothetical protein
MSFIPTLVLDIRSAERLAGLAQWCVYILYKRGFGAAFGGILLSTVKAPWDALPLRVQEIVRDLA